MPINEEFKYPFQENGIFHVYNRCVKGQYLFYEEADYTYFLNRFSFYLSDFVELYAWALMNNHFHFCIRVKLVDTMKMSSADLKRVLDPNIGLDKFLRDRFKRLFLSYSFTMRKKYNIKTNVFSQKFKHKYVSETDQLTQLFYYIHGNPLHHNIKTDWEKYPWTSYQDIINGDATHVKINFPIDWFGGMDKFLSGHKENCTRMFSLLEEGGSELGGSEPPSSELGSSEP